MSAIGTPYAATMEDHAEPRMRIGSMERVHLATGYLERAGAVLLVASRYPNHAEPIWNLPGGRQRHGELLAETVRREFREETALHVEVGSVRYVSESYDRATDTHFLAVAFTVEADGDPALAGDDPRIAEVCFVPLGELASRLRIDVVREPLLAYLRDPHANYHGYADAGITIEFPDDA
jgi:ADP-ribose pyrophosphatase YjhB (NUDIX family)